MFLLGSQALFHASSGGLSLLLRPLGSRLLLNLGLGSGALGGRLFPLSLGLRAGGVGLALRVRLLLLALRVGFLSPALRCGLFALTGGAGLLLGALGLGALLRSLLLSLRVLRCALGGLGLALLPRLSLRSRLQSRRFSLSFRFGALTLCLSSLLLLSLSFCGGLFLLAFRRRFLTRALRFGAGVGLFLLGF